MPEQLRLQVDRGVPQRPAGGLHLPFPRNQGDRRYAGLVARVVVGGADGAEGDEDGNRSMRKLAAANAYERACWSPDQKLRRLEDFRC